VSPLERRKQIGRHAEMPRTWWNRSSVTPLVPRGQVLRFERRGPAEVVPLAPRRRVHAASGRPKQAPGFPPAARKIITARDPFCVLAAWPGCPARCAGPLDPHHRDLIGMAGTVHPAKHHPANGLRLCRAHHDWVHGQRILARHLGLIVDRGENFRTRRMSFDGGRTWWQFRGDGTGYIRAAADGGDAA